MAKRATVQLLTAPAGTGKSYMVTWDLVHNFLPGSTGDVYTNMPWGVVPDHHPYPPTYEGETFGDRIGEFVAAKYGGEAESYSERLKIIPRDELNIWMDPNTHSGPWEYFKDVDLDSAWIVIDEAHNYAGRKHSKQKRGLWQKFCGELRHRGHSCIQFVTQTPRKLAQDIIDECGLRQALVDAELERDPFFGIELLYWYELKAKITGKFEACFVRIDLRDIDGKKKQNHVERVARKQEIFALYDSNNATEAGESGRAGEALKREHEKRNLLSLCWWFFSKNAGRFFRPAVFLGVMYVCVFHGGFLFNSFTSFASRSMTTSKTQPEKVLAADADLAPVVAVPAVPVPEPPSLELKVLTPTAATFSDGLVLSVGDLIDTGENKGEVIVQIDWKKRAVVLNNGVKLRIGGLRYSSASKRDTTSATLQTGATAIDPNQYRGDGFRVGDSLR